MKFSTRATYGLKALLYLADQYGQRAVSASQIAREEGISASYLEQILHRLKKKQWIKSLRGPAGGYVLGSHPSEIKIGPVLRDLEGVKRKAGKERTSSAKKPNTPGVAALLFWAKLEKNFSQLIDSTSLKNLVDEARSHQKTHSKTPGPSFNI